MGNAYPDAGLRIPDAATRYRAGCFQLHELCWRGVIRGRLVSGRSVSVT